MNRHSTAIDHNPLQPADGFGETFGNAQAIILFVGLIFVPLVETLFMQVFLGASISHSFGSSVVAVAVLATALLAIDWIMTSFGREIEARYARFSQQLNDASVESPFGRLSQEHEKVESK